MKRKFIFAGIITLLLINLVSAAYPGGIIEEKIGINQDSIKDPQQLKEEYLKKNWAELIAKNRILGPIHNFFFMISPVFQVLFGQPYSLSLVLLIIVILWFVLVRIGYLSLEITPFNGLTKTVLAIGSAAILAQIGFLNVISTFLVNLVISREAWWMRLIAILIMVVVIFVINYGAKLGARLMQKSKEKGEKLTMKQKIAETSAFLKGVKKGQNIVKD